MSLPRVAVCTLVRGRATHLRNMLRGLALQRRAPDRIVIAVMGGPDPGAVVHEVGLPARLVDASHPTSRLPLAAARNLARKAAGDVDVVVLLDVDVIPHPDLVGDHLDLLAQRRGIWSGRVDYLPPRPSDDDRIDPAHLDRLGRPHATRRPPDADVALPTPELFWSLSFAADTPTWDGLGGFDEGFVGYGAEDTDFALRADRAGVWLGWSPRARGWHQHHDSQVPPRQHLQDIVANAHRFRQRWGRWPMEGWLQAFAEEGLVDWDPDGEALDVALPR